LPYLSLIVKSQQNIANLYKLTRHCLECNRGTKLTKSGGSSGPDPNRVFCATVQTADRYVLCEDLQEMVMMLRPLLIQANNCKVTAVTKEKITRCC